MQVRDFMHPHAFLWSFVLGFLLGGSIAFGPWFQYRGLFLFGGAVAWLWMSLFQRAWQKYVLVALVGGGYALMLGGESSALWDRATFPSILTLRGEEVRVESFPVEKVLYQEVRLKRVCAERACSRGILWKAPLEIEVTMGEKFRFSCDALPVENFSEDFDYQKYLAKEGIGFLCQKGGMINERMNPDILGWLGNVLTQSRTRTQWALRRALPEPELGLAQGLILGGGNFLDQEIEEDFQRIGMTHIVAVSGYNILLVATGCFFVFGQLGLWRKQKILLSSLAIWLFILFVGAPASAVRAGSMTLFFFLALLLGRQGWGFTLLLVSAFLMLLMNPLFLFYDIGFQLSFMALLAILFASTHVHVAGHWTWRNRLSEAIRVTLWVEVFILPLIVYHFGTLTWFSVVANVLLLPLVPLAMLGAFFLLLVAFLPVHILLFLALPVYGVLWGIIRFAQFFSHFSWVSMDHISLSLFWLVVYYCGLVSFSMLQLRRRKKQWYAKVFMVAD